MMPQLSQQGPKLVGTGASGVPQQGASVALSADGNTAIVGGPGDNNGQGAAWVYTRSGGVWTQQGNKLVGTGASGVRNRAPPLLYRLTATRPSLAGPATTMGKGLRGSTRAAAVSGPSKVISSSQ